MCSGSRRTVSTSTAPIVRGRVDRWQPAARHAGGLAATERRELQPPTPAQTDRGLAGAAAGFVADPRAIPEGEQADLQPAEPRVR